MASRSELTLGELVKQLGQAYGAGLHSVVLYGSAASGEQVAGKSDQNVLVIVDRIDRARLQQLAQTSRAWTDAGNPPPLTLTLAEWKRSADIFPMEYADILDRHRVLSGIAPFDGVQVSLNDLRLQLEHEAMAMLLKLRAGVMAAGTDSKKQAALMTDSLSSVMVLLRATMRLHGELPPREYRAVAEAVAARAKFDVSAIVRVNAIRKAEGVQADTATTLDAYVASVEALVAYLDGYTA